jgi:uncharacterized repeat protein (TIGR03803 family)
MALTRRAVRGLVLFLILASLPLFARSRGDTGSSQNGLFANCPAVPPAEGGSGVCPFLNFDGTATLTGTDTYGNPVTVTISLYDWGYYPCTEYWCQSEPLINYAVLDLVLTGTEPAGIASLVVKGVLPNPSYVSCGGADDEGDGIGCIVYPEPDSNSDVQEPTPISRADTGAGVNTRWDFGGVPPLDPPPPAVPFDQLQCEPGFYANPYPCTGSPLGEAVLVVANSVAQNKLSTSASNYLVTLIDGTQLGGFTLPKSPTKLAQNNTQATAKAITGTSFKDYTNTAQAYPEINPDGSMNYPPSFALAPAPPPSSPSFPSCYAANETRTFRTLWYTYTAPGDGSVTINTTGSRYDTLVYVFPQANPATTTACDDDTETGALQAVTTFSVTQGAEYEIVVYETPPFVGTGYAYPLSVDGTLYFSLKFETTVSTTTTTKLSSSPNPSFSGQGVTFTATVTPKLPGTPTGIVTFSEAGTVLGTSSLDAGGQASLNTVLAIGKNLITAEYSGDSYFLGSSASEKQTVYAGGTITALSSSVYPSAVGQPVTFTAMVMTQPSGEASGTVKFVNGTTKLGTAVVSGNSASLTTSFGSVGTDLITASYSGNHFYEPSVSNTWSQTVQAPTTTTIVSSQNPYLQNGSPVTFTVTVTSAVETPTGTVYIWIPGLYQEPTLTLNSGSAQYTTTLLPVGTVGITAAYRGNADLFGSTSQPLDQVTQFPSNISVLHNFKVDGTDGYLPYAGVSQDSERNLYGTTEYGGSGEYGTAFEVSASGQETVLYNFTGANGDGARPLARPILDQHGNLYGTTFLGGNLSCATGYGNGCGTVFELSPPAGSETVWSETVLHAFTDAGGDGLLPTGSLVQDSQGNLYGSTPEYGGANGYGTVFMLAPSGQEVWVYDFAGNGEYGIDPSGLTTPDSQGNLYGTTTQSGEYGCGTVFMVNSTGQVSVVYNFTGPPNDGCGPTAGLVRDSKGNLYGPTGSGGSSDSGTVFMLNAAGQETILYNFIGPEVGSPDARLVRDSQGNLYGTTSGGGAYAAGTVFEVAPNGQETTLYTFTGSGAGVDGASPQGGLLLDSQDNLYGTTSAGGMNRAGMVFKLAPQ